MGRKISYVTLFIISLPLLVHSYVRHRVFVHVPIAMSWDDARKYCRANHTDLAIFENWRQFEELPNLCEQRKRCWVGLQRAGWDPKIWQWIDGGKVTLTNWMEGEPNRLDEFCGFVADEKWHDNKCEYRYEFLCHDDLILVEKKKTWEEALDYCRALQTDTTAGTSYHRTGTVSGTNYHYDLAHMSDANAKFVTETNHNTHYWEVWTGLRFLAGRWLWVNGFPLEDQLGEKLPVCPAPMMECGTMSINGRQFSLKNCSEERTFFCSLRNQ